MIKKLSEKLIIFENSRSKFMTEDEDPYE